MTVASRHHVPVMASQAVLRARAWLGTAGCCWGAAADDLTAIAEDLAAVAEDRGLGGRIVALPVANEPAGVARLIGLLLAGASPLVLPADAPRAEVLRLAQCAGASAVADAGHMEILPSGGTDTVAQAICLCTSGSTGEPKVVRRDLATWEAEAERYLALLRPERGQHVVVGVPVAHAYAMGWLWACMMGGLTVELHPASALGAVASAIRTRACYAVLSPTTAGLLAARRMDQGTQAAAINLKVAMAGAGPVTQALSERFRQAFGVPLSTNYGSTETGALLAALAPVPEGVTGYPMPGVTAGLSSAGTLLVIDEAGRSHDTGDLAEALADGGYRVLGRTGDAVRRGDRWIAPREVAEVLAAAPGVVDVHVRAVDGVTAGQQRLIATVAGAGGASLAAGEVAAFGAARLSPAKRPDLLEVAPDIPRNAMGKPLRQKRRRLAEPAALAEAARAYKRSILLFSLYDTGLYECLVSGATADEAAVACGLKPDAVERLLTIAESCGLVVSTEQVASQTAFRAVDLVALERELSRDLVTPEAVTEVLRSGLPDRLFDRGAGPSSDLRALYAAAMHGTHRQAGRMLAMRALKQGPAVRSVLEVGASPGHYVAAILQGDAAAHGVLLPIGRLAPEPAPEARVLAEAGRLRLCPAATAPAAGLPTIAGDAVFDLVICDNGIHGPSPGGNLDALIAVVAPGGALLIDDIFLPRGPDAAIGLDWLTHGGCANAEVDSLVKRLEQAGGTVRRLMSGVDGLQSVILTTWT